MRSTKIGSVYFNVQKKFLNGTKQLFSYILVADIKTFRKDIFQRDNAVTCIINDRN